MCGSTLRPVKVAAATCLVLAVACVVAAVVGYGMARSPECFDPPCGGAKDVLILYGTGGAIVFGVLAALLGLISLTRGRTSTR